MQLTPEQIAGLPPDQQAQVVALQEHIVRTPKTLNPKSTEGYPAILLPCTHRAACMPLLLPSLAGARTVVLRVPIGCSDRWMKE